MTKLSGNPLKTEVKHPELVYGVVVNATIRCCEGAEGVANTQSKDNM